MAHHVRRNSESSRKIDPTILSDRKSSFLDSLTRWPASLPSADSMADAGFYFTPTEKNADCVTCFRCGVKMFNWLPDDTPKSEHMKFSPTCREVKSWTNVVVEPNRAVNRADQVDTRLRNKLADKAKKLTLTFHRKHERSLSREAIPPMDSQPLPQSQPQESLDRPLNEEERFAEVRRKREVAEKSLDGLQKLASFYPIGSQEQRLAEQSMVLQTADLEKLRNEEQQLLSSMGSLSFGRGWRDVTVDSPATPHSYTGTSSLLAEEESPEVTRGKATSRALPQLPSQLKNTMPRMPAKMARSQSIEATSFESTPAEVESAPASEWVEYFTEDGTPYYYSNISKTTVWQIPESTPVV